MIAGLQRFLRVLRSEGVAVSPAEWLDALRAVQLVGIEDRGRFRAALSATLVKRAWQRALFESIFEEFFKPPARRARRAGRRGSTGESGTGQRRRFAANNGSAAQPVRRMDRSRTRRRRAKPAPREREALENLLSSTREGARRESRLKKVVLGQAARERSARVAGNLREVPLEQDLRRPLSSEQERELSRSIGRLIERIRLRSGARLRPAKRGKLYLRRIFRDNLARGGVPFLLPYRKGQPQRSKVVLLMDVSWSTARAAGFFLMLAAEFLRRIPDLRILVFVDRPLDATRELEHWLSCRASAKKVSRSPRLRQPGEGIVRGGRSFADLLTALPGLNLQAPSDYGRAFHSLLRSPLRPSGRNTLLLILGDGRTNEFDPLSWALDELTARLGAVLWLVPEPLSLWGTGDSALDRYLPHIDAAVEAHDLQGLARGVSELLRRL